MFLTYVATQFDGSALPSWLTFTSLTRTFSGTPLASYVGTLNIKVTAADGNGGTVDGFFDITVFNAPPVLALALPNESVNAGVNVNYSFASNTFTDANGDVLSYVATQSNGSLLPSWLSFDGATRSFSGTANFVTTVSVKVVAADGNGGTAFDIFDIDVANPFPNNTAPTISGSPALIATVNDLYTFTPTANDADAVHYFEFSITNKPSWANFDTATGSLSGIPLLEDLGTETPNIIITVTDGVFSASLSPFDILVVPESGGFTTTHAKVFELDKHYRTTGFVRELELSKLSNALANFDSIGVVGKDHETN